MKKVVALAIVAGSIIFSGCGGGGDDSSSSGGGAIASYGAFLSDSRIAGVTYTCGSTTGVTDSKGAFEYSSACSEVVFTIGGVSLGSIPTANLSEDAVFYPSDLLSLDRNNTSNVQLINMLQLFQSLDSDGNPNNGIDINATLLDGVTLALDDNTTTIADINSTLNGIGVSLVERDHAIAHYEDTLREDLNITVDTVPPAPAIITVMPSETYSDMTSITINGEVGAAIWIDGVYANLSIDANNSATFDVNTSENSDVNNTSSIVLKDDTNGSSDTVQTSIFRASDATLNSRDVALMKTAFESSSNSRTFVYTPVYTTADDYTITMSEATRAESVETQEYNVTATLAKGTITDTVVFAETVPFSQSLRDTAEIEALKTALTARSFTYTQQWETGSDYNVTMSEPTRGATVETQTYDVTATLAKGTITDTVTFSETVPFSQVLRDLAEIAALKSVITQRAFTYTQNWATGIDYSVSMSEPTRVASTEIQTYEVTATFTKGAATDTVIFSETVPFSQALRDIAEVASIKNTITSRNFSYAQQWMSGDSYSVVFSTPLASATTENQTYNVIATITKGAATDSLAFEETVPFSQDLRDTVEVQSIQTSIVALVDKRSSFSYAQQWMTGSDYTIVFSESRRIPTAIDQSYEVTITITKGSQTLTVSYTEYVPTTNVNISLGDGTTTLINDEYADAFTVTNGGIFQKVGEESRFIGTAFSVDAAQFNNIASSNDLLNYIVSNSGLSGLTSVSLNNSQDGSLVARYEIDSTGENLYEILESLLASFSYSIDNIDLTQYADVNTTVVDLYVEYDAANNSYMIVTLSDKTIDVDSDIAKIINKDSIVQVNETIVNEQETFTMTSSDNRGDFLFVMDDSGSMSNEQTAAVEAIERTFGSSVTKYGLDFKATVIGTGSSYTYSSLMSNPSENNISKLATQLALGTSGSSDERGLKRAYYALNGGYVVERNSSSMSVIYISDEPEHSTLADFGESDDDYSDSYFVNNNIKYNVIIPSSYIESEKATRMYLATQGSRANLTNYTSGYNQMMDNVVKYAAAKSSPIKLAYPALASSITVHVNGTKTTAWEYDASLKSIVFEAANMPTVNSEIIVTYSHLDYTDILAAAVTDFDALVLSQKRAFVSGDLTVSFDPVQPLTPLANSDQTYDVTVTFEILGYSQTTTFEETVVNYLDAAQAEFDALANDEKRVFISSDVNVTFDPAVTVTPLTDTNQTYDVTVTFELDGNTLSSTYEETVIASNFNITSNTDWLQNENVLTSQNHADGSSSTLELTILRDTTIDYVVSSETSYDKLRVTVNGTLLGDYGNTNGTFNVSSSDVVLLEYHKDSSASSGTDNAIVTIH